MNHLPVFCLAWLWSRASRVIHECRTESSHPLVMSVLHIYNTLHSIGRGGSYTSVKPVCNSGDDRYGNQKRWKIGVLPSCVHTKMCGEPYGGGGSAYCTGNFRAEREPMGAGTRHLECIRVQGTGHRGLDC